MIQGSKTAVIVLQVVVTMSMFSPNAERTPYQHFVSLRTDGYFGATWTGKGSQTVTRTRIGFQVEFVA